MIMMTMVLLLIRISGYSSLAIAAIHFVGSVVGIITGSD